MSLPQTPYYRCALALIAKIPGHAVGDPKAQPSPPLTSSEAIALKHCFLRDMAATIGQIADAGRAEAVAFFTPSGAESVLRQMVPKGFKLFPQRGSRLGEVLANATEDLLNRGFPSVCLINADSVTLPRSFLTVAIESLARPGDRMVVGGVNRGGYYLIGLKDKHRSLFDRVSSNSSDVVLHTTTCAAGMGLKVEMLPPWYDVNDEKDLNRLCLELLGRDGRDKVQIAPYTRQYLAKLIETEGPSRISPSLARELNV
jgi:glycosyltransferase A (GT-A) superfamily protein (DUF2064 family)